MEIYAIGGYNEVGRNMSAVSVGDDIVVLDMGINITPLAENGDLKVENLAAEELYDLAIVPDDRVVKDKKKVVAIVLSHGHLDHIGAVFALAEQYNCPIIGTPYTLEILRKIIKGDSERKERIQTRASNSGKNKNEKLEREYDGAMTAYRELRNKFIVVPNNSKYKLNKNIIIEFVRCSHSIPDAAIVILHTQEGVVVYANDWKFDDSPTNGDIPNYKRLFELGKQGIRVLFDGAINVEKKGWCPSEYVGQELLKGALLKTQHQELSSYGSLLVVTAFASNIARFQSVQRFAEILGRRLMVFGGSTVKYITAAQALGKVYGVIELYKGRMSIKKALDYVKKDPSKYLIFCTGNQGEHNAVLTRIAGKDYAGYTFPKGTQVFFSSSIIPSDINRKNVENLEKLLVGQGCRIYRDLHASGHAYKEEHRELIRLLKPRYIIPCHVGDEGKMNYFKLGVEEGYKIGTTMLALNNGDV
ncbi:MAG: hypothetical protein CVU81_02165, partial [Euryarchaeota archaeon HGW-Euryarchaeota-1]